MEEAYEKLEATNEKLQGRRAPRWSSATACPRTRGHGRQGLRDLLAGADARVPRLPDKVDGELSTLGWLYHMNHGIFMTPGVEEEWTLSIAHSDEDIERY